jgi:4-amino-4-deoxy-L-arabinose transferase-like glycosyltransferase
MKITYILVAMLCLIFFGLSLGSALRESLTYDEIVHLEEGENALVRHTFLIDTYNPPLVRELASLPLVLGAGTLIQSNFPNIQVLPARLAVTSLGLILCIGVFFVAKKYFGVAAALLAVFLLVFEPNVLAYSHYVTLDIGSTLFFFLAYMAFIRFLLKPTKGNGIISGISAGCMLAAKLTLLPFFAVSSMAASLFLLRNSIFTWLWSKKILLLLSLCVALLTLWATYFFNRDVIIVASVRQGRLSDKIVQAGNPVLSSAIRFLKTQPVPLGNYIAAIKNTIIFSDNNKQVFFWGKFYDHGQWYFLLVNAFVKSSLPLIFIFMIGSVNGLRDKKLRQSVILLLVPIGSVLLFATIGMLPRAQARYLLPMYPFVVIIAASIIRYCKKPTAVIFLIILCVWHAAQTLSFYPHFISFTNELVDRKTSYTKLIDSNIDWGQSLITFKRYTETIKPSEIRFSYFGRDDAATYGLSSVLPFGGYKAEDICAFHNIDLQNNSGPPITAISVSNWYYCGYNRKPEFVNTKIKSVVGESILIF